MRVNTKRSFSTLTILILLLVGKTLFAIEQVDGTVGAPLGGIGAGAIKFCAWNGTFAYVFRTPCAIDGFRTLPSTQFQLYTNRGGTIQTNTQMTAVSNSGRYDDDSVYPIHKANFGTVNGITVTLTAFAPVYLSSVTLMTFPYAFFELQVTNTQASSADIAIAFQTDTGATPTGVSGKGFQTNSKAIYSNSDGTAVVSYGNDGGFFTSGQLNGSLSGTVNKVALKVTLSASQTRKIQFVYSWMDTGYQYPTRFYYTNFHTNAGSFADAGLQYFNIMRDNALALVNKVRGSNFPDWLKNQALNSLCNLTNNSIYTKDGRYCHTEGEWNINGTMDQMWHARQLNIMLVPEIAWKELEFWARTQKQNPLGQIHHDFGAIMDTVVAWDDTEHADYRDINKWVDLNCAFIISVYEAFIATDESTINGYCHNHTVSRCNR